MAKGLLPQQLRLDPVDTAHIERTIGFIATHDTTSVIAELLPALSPASANWLGSVCQFDHAGTLIFPESVPQLRADLHSAGIVTGPPTPSVIVRQRLSQRYGLAREELDVVILRAPISARGGERCEIEIFALATTLEHGQRAIVRGERACGHESHVALRIHDKGVAPAALRAMLTGNGLHPDGGGYNGYIDATVLYFRNTRGQRLELIAAGQH